MNEIEDRNGHSFWTDLGFFFQGFISTCFSRKYYQEIAQKPLIFGIGFFLVFGLFIAGVTTATMLFGLGTFGEEIRSAYETGDFPTIIIEDGITTVYGPQPIVFSEGRQFFGIDTSGSITEIDTFNFSEGLLITRDEFHVVNEDGYEKMQLSDLNAVLGNPIVIDQENVLKWLSIFSTFFLILTFFAVFIGNTLYWFIILLLIGLVIWGIVTTKRKDIGFSQVMIVGLLTFVPATYIDFLLNKLNVQFCGMHMLIAVIIWAFVLRDVLQQQEMSSE